MRKDKLSKQNVILYFLGIIPVVWLGLLIAPCLEDGLIGLVQQFGTIMQNPFRIELCEDSVKAVLVLLLAYGIAIGVYLSSEHNYRRREEHGSAKWGTAGSVNKKYANKDKTENKILTQNVAIGLDGRKHRRNLNVLVCGGSGAGKTRFFAKPNIMNANTSFVVLDPKGELLRDTGHLLKEHGYDIKVLDLINMEKSHCYNPFVYLQSDDDIQRLTTNLFKNTTPKGSQTQDPFWDQTAAMLLKALVCYLHYEAPPDEQNFPMVMEMIRAGDVKENNEDYLSVLDELFERLEAKNPEHIALKYYRAYHSGSAKTLKSIQISLVSRLEKFNLDSLAGITQTDEMDLGEIGERKTAVFAVIPDNDSSFNFIVGMLYTQLFQQLYYQADSVHGGRLPVHVHFVMDEFANVALPDEFDKLLSTMRSREISVSIIIQNLAQLKALFEKQWESIVGNCDEFLYLGGNEQSTHEYVSKLLGKETIDTNTYGRSRGRNGSYSTNYQLTGRELMVDGYGENNPIVVKSEFIMSLIEQIDKKGVGPQHKSIIDRCITNVYRNAAEDGTVPTLCTLRDMLLEQPEPEAKQIALSLELYTTGSLDIFGKQSNVDLDKRIVVFDIHGLGSQLKPTGLLVITDTMLNRVTLNWKKGKRTHVFIDEFHVVFENEFSAQFFNSAWRQFRKRNAYPTAITQNVEYLLDSVQASTMLSNSEFVIMLNQAASDREKLARLLNISNEQMSYITNADAGCGLIKYGSALVPFINQFPHDTKLYQLMTTRPGEGEFARGQD